MPDSVQWNSGMDAKMKTKIQRRTVPIGSVPVGYVVVDTLGGAIMRLSPSCYIENKPGEIPVVSIRGADVFYVLEDEPVSVPPEQPTIEINL